MDTAFVATIKALLATFNPGNGAGPVLMPQSILQVLHSNGAWNPATNVPRLSPGVGQLGGAYLCSGAGTTSLDGLAVWAINDYAFFNPITARWARIIGATGEWVTGIGAAQNTPMTPADIQAALAGSSLRIASGQRTLLSASDTVVTGLATVVAVIASLDSAPVLTCDRGTASIGDQAGTPAAGSILVQGWMPTSVSNPTPIAATGFATKKVNWIALGT